MLLLSPLVLLASAALFLAARGAGDLQGAPIPGGAATFDPSDPCMVVTPPCMSEADRFSLEALRSIHQMMDDDQDGGIEVEESVEFIIEDMKQQQTHKHNMLHREDQHITVEELWRGWKSSEVHNWTQDEVLRWLKEFVELPQYERNFKDFRVNGNTLPRIAANEPSFLSGQLRVQDQRDKQKLNIKALDVVLFGPPTRPPHNYMKDLLLIVSVVMGVGGCWFAQAQNKASKVHITRMMKDLESLQRAEQSLIDLQEQLERAQEEKRNVAEEKQNLEEKMRDEIMGAQEEAFRLHELRQGAVSELSRLRYAEEELEQVRGALKQAEQDMQASWSVSEVLQQWLQLTHEVEVQYYGVKKQSAERQLATAKEEAERIKKKRSSVLGTLHMAHSSSLDQVDQKILEAKNALSDVTACLRERLHRWQNIELLCGFPVIRNPGLASLTAQLYSDSVALGTPRAPQQPCSFHGSLEDLLEGPAAPILPQKPVPAPPLKRSPRTRGSAICRSRRSGVLPQPPAALASPDPDLAVPVPVPVRAPFPGYEEPDGRFLKSMKKQNSQEKFTDSDYLAQQPLGKIFPGSAADSASRKLYLDGADPLDGSEAEAPVRKRSVEELEASADLFSRKTARDKAFEAAAAADEPVMDAPSRRISRERGDAAADLVLRKASPNEPDAEFSLRKAEKDAVGDLLEIPLSRNVFRERSDVALEVRKILWNEVETDAAPRKISRDMLGASVDSAARKMAREDGERTFEVRRISRDTLGKLPWSKAEAPVRVLVKETMVEAVRTPSRKISRDELEYDAAALMMLPRELLLDPASVAEQREAGLEAPGARKMARSEADMAAGSLRRRIPRMLRDDVEVEPLCWERPEDPAEGHQAAGLREDPAPLESGSYPGRGGQPDLMPTPQAAWKSSSDLFSGSPLSQLVYDGILEKSCHPLAASLAPPTPSMPQGRPQAAAEPPLPPPRAAVATAVPSPSDGSEEKSKEKEKSKKSIKLKNLFKKKSEPSPEKLQSGLQKL